MSGLAEPIGHDSLRAMLRGLAERSAAGDASLQHAWLFSGPAGVGKFTIARWWASLLKCPELGRCEPRCESCRLAAGAVHPDIFETGPAPKDRNAVQSADVAIERKKSVGIEESRALISRLSLRPTRPGPRVGIVREAGTMTNEAQNALLKLLEEPPGSAVIILVSDNSGAMLTTVRSRCRHLAFGSLSVPEIVEVLRRSGREGSEAEAAAACARGSVARAFSYDADGLADREEILLAFEQARKDPAALEPLVAALVARKESGYALGEILEWQMAKLQTSLGRAVDEPSAKLAELLAEQRDSDSAALVADAQQIQWTIDALARNANARLVIRDMLLNVRASAR